MHRPPLRSVCIVLAALTGLAAARIGLTAVRRAPAEREGALYLPAAEYLRFLSLGNDGLAADLVLARALTYYGAHHFERDFPYRHLENLLSTAVKLQPDNEDAVILSANLLAPRQPHAAIRILSIGMKHSPRSWKFPEMIGFCYFFHLKDDFRAARYYEIAAGKPGHPPYVPSLAARFYRESGRLALAVRVLANFHAATRDPRLKADFARQIERLLQEMGTAR